MSQHHREEVGRILAEHERTIDELHKKLAHLGEPDKARLTAASTTTKERTKPYTTIVSNAGNSERISLCTII